MIAGPDLRRIRICWSSMTTSGIRGLLQKFLARNGYWVTTARDAAHARRLLDGLEFDLLVFDVMMPGEDGFTLTRDLRRRLTTPIMLLTAKGDADDRIRGLEAGADDYLPKPFEPRELLLRINAILRRVPKTGAAQPPRNIQMGEVRFDLVRGELWNGNTPVHLTATEALLMRIFSARPGEAISRLIWSRNWVAPTDRPRKGRSMFRSPVCAARSNPIRKRRAICKPYADRAICFSRTDPRDHRTRDPSGLPAARQPARSS